MILITIVMKLWQLNAINMQHLATSSITHMHIQDNQCEHSIIPLDIKF